MGARVTSIDGGNRNTVTLTDASEASTFDEPRSLLERKRMLKDLLECEVISQAEHDELLAIARAES